MVPAQQLKESSNLKRWISLPAEIAVIAKHTSGNLRFLCFCMVLYKEIFFRGRESAHCFLNLVVCTV